jgi:hypothetical protein
VKLDANKRWNYAGLIVIGVAAGAFVMSRKGWFMGRSTVGDVEPLRFDRAPAELFEAVRQAARHMSRWRVVDEFEEDLRLHAETKTFVLPITRRLRIWLEPEASGCRLMIESPSESGWSCADARTIGAFKKAVERELRAMDRPGEVGRPDRDVEIMAADEGTGPLLQREYTGVVTGSSWEPEDVIREIRTDIERFSPAEMATFIRPPDDKQPLAVDDDVEVHLAGAGETLVKVVHVDPRSFTLRTMDDHTEAGRITFGSWRDNQGRLVIHIRSRARQAGPIWLIGFVLGGKALQKRIWETFIERVAEAAGGKLVEGVKSKTKKVEESPADQGKVDAPTFTVPSAA